jgi:hypothetical protein
MASEPVSTTDQDVESPPGPTSAEDRKAAAALSNLDSRTTDDDKKHNVDTEALGKAMENLDVTGKEEEAKKKVKVEAKDVTLLVSYQRLTKVFRLIVTRWSSWMLTRARRRNC